MKIIAVKLQIMNNRNESPCIYLYRIIQVTMKLVENGNITGYLYSHLEQLEVLRSKNNPKETMQYLIPYTNLVWNS